MPRDGAGRSAAVPVQNSKPPEPVALINISAHFLTTASKLTLRRDARSRSRGVVTAETVAPPPPPRSDARRLRGRGRPRPEKKTAVWGPFLPEPSVHPTHQRAAACRARGCFFPSWEEYSLKEESGREEEGVPEHPTGMGRGGPHSSSLHRALQPVLAPLPPPQKKPAGTARTSTDTDLYSQPGWMSPRRANAAGSAGLRAQPLPGTVPSPGCAGRPLRGTAPTAAPGPPPAHAPSHPAGRAGAPRRIRSGRASPPSHGWTEPREGAGQPRPPPSPLPSVCIASAAPHDGDKKARGPPKIHSGQLGKQLAWSWQTQPRAERRNRLFTESINPPGSSPWLDTELD